MMANTVDLHTHSTASDGLLSPADLVREAGRLGVRTISLTDHDTIDGLAEAQRAGAGFGVEVIPGVELGSSIERHEHHLLGYFIEPGSDTLRRDLSELAARRRVRVETMVTRLNEVGVRLTLDEVYAEAGRGSVGRPHVARVLVASGQVGSIAEAFDRFLKFGQPGYVPRQPFTPEEAVAMIIRAGGAPVLAHPLSTGDPEAAVRRLRPAGLLGLEVFYGEYRPAIWEELAGLARTYDLIATGGSDYHGPNYRAGRELGGPPVPPDTVERLRAAVIP